MLEKQIICGAWRIFLKNSSQFNCSGQTRDSWTTITKQNNTAVDHSGNNTVLISNKFNYYFWTICKHLLCAISYLGQY